MDTNKIGLERFIRFDGGNFKRVSGIKYVSFWFVLFSDGVMELTNMSMCENVWVSYTQHWISIYIYIWKWDLFVYTQSSSFSNYVLNLVICSDGMTGKQVI